MFNLAVVEKKLRRDKCEAGVVEDVLGYITNNLKAFTYANESSDILECYIVMKNTGGFKAFKTIKGYIINDKLDNSYTSSRELVSIADWNIRGVYQVSFKDGVGVQKISSKELHRVLFSLIEPTYIKYVLGLEEGNFTSSIMVDYLTYKHLDYDKLKQLVLSTYHRIIKESKNCGMSALSDTQEPVCYAVSYSVNT